MLRALSRHRSRLASISIALLSLFLIPGCIIVVGGRGHHDWDWDSEFQHDERLVERFTFDIESGAPVTIATENGSVSGTSTRSRGSVWRSPRLS
ncbi:MAG: hypothetical protein ACYTF7_11315 [Planctomycetota bacterium]|jgi:hypothetical protein